eukprot:2942762-Pleurochrysis_carterae.AAC.1
MFFGGSSDPSKSQVKRVELKPEKTDDGVETGDFKEVESVRRRMDVQGVQFARLMLGRKAILAGRKQRLVIFRT